MSIATTQETEQLINEYGLYDATIDFSEDDPDMALCYSLAITNAIIITARNIARGEIGKTPDIVSVKLPIMKDAHAYLVYEGKVYNHRVTFPTTKYPDFDTDELMKRGAYDFTKVLAHNALMAYQGKEDKYGLGFVSGIPENFDVDGNVFLLALGSLINR